jgi:hypothetical protein
MKNNSLLFHGYFPGLIPIVRQFLSLTAIALKASPETPAAILFRGVPDAFQAQDVESALPWARLFSVVFLARRNGKP